MFERRTQERLKKIGVSNAHIPVFRALKDGNALSQTALAEVARIEQPTMAQMLERSLRCQELRRCWETRACARRAQRLPDGSLEQHRRSDVLRPTHAHHRHAPRHHRHAARMQHSELTIATRVQATTPRLAEV